MKCLAVADLHYSLPQYDWVLSVADRFDVVILAGDHIDLSSLVDFNAQSIVVQKYVARLRERTRVITCSGNHDLDSRNALGEKVAKWISDLGDEGNPSDGASILLGDTLITVCPWWDGPLVRQEIAGRLAADAVRRPPRWIWVHHAPPGNSPTSWGGSRYFGDVELEQWIAAYQPDMVFSGHVHQSPFAQGGSWVDRIGSTWVFNAGHQFERPPPTSSSTLTGRRPRGSRPPAISSFTSIGRWSARSANSQPCPTGLHPRIVLAVGARREFDPLLVDEGLEDIAEHSQMIV